jgi:negative regulator of sigma E activity
MIVAIGPMVGAGALPNAPMPAMTVGALLGPSLGEALLATAIVAAAAIVIRLVSGRSGARPAHPVPVLRTTALGQAA